MRQVTIILYSPQTHLLDGPMVHLVGGESYNSEIKNQ